jgi:hypothetical protein
MVEEVKSGNVTYRNDKYRIPTGYNWLPANGVQDSAERVSVNNIYKKAVKLGKFNGSYSDFLSNNSDIIKKHQGDDDKVSSGDAKTIISLISPGEVMADFTGSDNLETRIMGFKPWVFYTGLTIVLVGAGFGVYKLFKK